MKTEWWPCNWQELLSMQGESGCQYSQTGDFFYPEPKPFTEYLCACVQSATAWQKMQKAKRYAWRKLGGGWKCHKSFALKVRHSAWQVPDVTDKRDVRNALLLQQCSGVLGIFARIARAVLGPAYDFLEFMLDGVAHRIRFQQATEGCAVKPGPGSGRMAKSCGATQPGADRFSYPSFAPTPERMIIFTNSGSWGNISCVVRRQTGTRERENGQIVRCNAAWGG